MLKLLLSLRGCGSAGQFASRGGKILLFRAGRSPRLGWKQSHDPRSSCAHARFVATQRLERQDAGRLSACGAIVMCAFWLRARSNDRGTSASLQLAIGLHHAFDLSPPQTAAPKQPPACCAFGGALKFIAMIRPADYATRTTGPPVRST